MADPSKSNDVSKKADTNNEIVTTRVNIAFPFSRIRVQEPSADLAELAALVRDLAAAVADVAPGPKTAELGKRAEALAARLK
ncbi:MAG: hypothetical protein JWM72_72 [Actinomycetia bacterium]|jgi:DNA topoisomerase VI subunit B|nr:hypothetical protein [Actinomycetes bacterium]MDQ1459551.1 hypothetical protein [Actinomycetota bacterium]